MSEAHLTMGAHAAPPMEERPFAIPSKKLAMWLLPLHQPELYCQLSTSPDNASAANGEM